MTHFCYEVPELLNTISLADIEGAYYNINLMWYNQSTIYKEL